MYKEVCRNQILGLQNSRYLTCHRTSSRVSTDHPRPHGRENGRAGQFHNWHDH